jgi:HAMP domain-containing protein
MKLHQVSDFGGAATSMPDLCCTESARSLPQVFVGEAEWLRIFRSATEVEALANAVREMAAR